MELGGAMCVAIGPDPEKNLGNPCPSCATVGDPIHPASGNNLQQEADFAGSGPGALQFVRSYNSANVFDNPTSGALNALTMPLGKRWRHTYSGFISLTATVPFVAKVVRSDGKVLTYVVTGDGGAVADPDVTDRLQVLTGADGGTTGYRLSSRADDAEELYDVSGKLLRRTERSSAGQRLSYSDGVGGVADSAAPNALGYQAPPCVRPGGLAHREDGGVAPAGVLLCATDAFGRQLNFQYDSRFRVVKLADPAGGLFQYEYDGASGNGTGNNLTRVIAPDNAARVYHYNEAARTGGATLPNALTGITDENGARFASMTYDPTGRATLTEHAGGVERTTLAYGAASATAATTTVTDERTQARVYAFLVSFGVWRNTGVSGPPCPTCGDAVRTFDVNGNVSGNQDWNGNRTRQTYELARNLETSRLEGLTDAGLPTGATRTVETSWHPSLRLPTSLTEKSADGGVVRVTTATYDTAGNLLTATATDPVAGATRTDTFTHDSLGRVLTHDGPRTDVTDTTTYTYYSAAASCPGTSPTGCRGQLSTETNALGHTTLFVEYNALGLPTLIQDANAVGTVLSYDVRGRLTSKATAGATTTFAYDAVGQLTRVTNPDGTFLDHAWDPAHRLIELLDAQGNRIAYTLDSSGNRTAETVYNPTATFLQTRTRVYSPLNRLTQDVSATAQSITYAYDSQGNLTTVTDPLNRITRFAFDPLNRMVGMTDPSTGQTLRTLDALDRLTALTTPRGLVTSYSYRLEKPTQVRSPEAGTQTMTYDDADNLLSSTDAKGQVTRTAWDALNRPTLVTLQGGATQALQYDTGPNAVGHLTRITDATGVLGFSWNAQGSITSESRTVAGVTYQAGRTWNAAGQVMGLTYPSGRTVDYLRDTQGRISRVRTTLAGVTNIVADNIAWHPLGGVKSFTYGNGETYARTFDTDGRIASYTLGASRFDLTFNSTSQLVGLAEVGNVANTNTYGYDGLKRLIAAAVPGTNYAYSYDADGNRLTRTVGTATEGFSYDTASNRLAAVTGASPRTMTFDANGALTSDGVTTYAYDARGRMVQAMNAGGMTTYELNALGQRVRKRKGAADRVFHYDASGQLMAEYSGAGLLFREYIYLNDLPLAVIEVRP